MYRTWETMSDHDTLCEQVEHNNIIVHVVIRLGYIVVDLRSFISYSSILQMNIRRKRLRADLTR